MPSDKVASVLRDVHPTVRAAVMRNPSADWTTKQFNTLDLEHYMGKARRSGWSDGFTIGLCVGALCVFAITGALL